MIRIFSALAILSTLLLLANIGLGLAIGDYNGASREYLARHVELEGEIRELRQQRPRPLKQIAARKEKDTAARNSWLPIHNRALVHILLGVTAALVAVLVNSICVTYFVGTSRWIREVVETYRFSDDWIARADRLKRRTFPWAVVGMLTAVGIIALGAAAHPGTARAGTAWWVTPHLIGALVGTTLIGVSFYIQANNIQTNYQIIQQIVQLVQKVRRERGLDDQPDASSETVESVPAS